MDITFVLVAMLGVFITGIAKSGFGGGLGVVAVPMMAPFIGAAEAIGILLPMLLFMDILTLRGYRQHLSWQLIKPLLPGMLVGIVLGALLLDVVSDSGVQLIVGLMGFWVLAQRRWPWLAGKVSADKQPPATIMGGMAGLSSTLSHAGGAPVQGYFLLRNLSRDVFLAQVALAVAVMNAVKLVPYGMLGLLNLSFGMITLFLIPVGVLGVWLGRSLSQKLDGDIFFTVMMWLLGCNSIYLVTHAIFLMAF